MKIKNPSFAVSGFQVDGLDELDASGRSGGYTQPANRTLFPLANGLIVWEGTHAEWTSTLSSPSYPKKLRLF